jgi:hypothetical protein
MAFDDSSEGGVSGSGPSDALQRLKSQIAEAKEYAAHLLSARSDQWKLRLLHVAGTAALAIFGILAVSAMVVEGCVLLLSGLARGIGSAFETAPWLGEVIAGAAALCVVFAAGVIAKHWLLSSRFRSTRKKYEQLKSRERETFGRDVDQSTRLRAAN